uniref:Phlebovirus_G2 domain-containing protein n=1 Tax=Angiostrongylus cantonensis TaxID=6313 RepID=A0A158PBB8_ANGCA
MSILVLLVLLPSTLSENITAEENKYLKDYCAKHFLIYAVVLAFTFLSSLEITWIVEGKSKVCYASALKNKCMIVGEQDCLNSRLLLCISPAKYYQVCFKLPHSKTSLHKIRIEWKALTLTSETDTDLFTRDTAHHVIDSKRCPRTGPCKGQKCARINATSLIPELAIGSKYPEITASVESCGGPGCDCFYWSSGCLFYRIYLSPTSSTIYEIFRCNR